MKKTIKLIDLDCGHCADKIQKSNKRYETGAFSGLYQQILAMEYRLWYNRC